nr:HAMP domain-containing protein [Desulfobacula sp.]
MRLSFQWKIRIIVCLLSVSLSSLGLYCLYAKTYQTILGSLKKNLRDVGNLGAMLFDHDSREALKRLKIRALEESVFDRQAIEALPPGGTTRSITAEKIKELHASKDFQMILHHLKKINYATYKDAAPLLKNYEFENIAGMDKGMMGAFLLIGPIETLEEDICMILASAGPEPTEDGWPGNPIGNIIRNFNPWSKVSERIFILDELNTDDFYQFLGGTVPILDENRKTIALLGIDYPVGSELNKLRTLKWICFAVIFGSFVLALFFSFIISKFLSRPLKLLTEGVKEIGKGHLQTQISIPSNDEFNHLAKAFNNMAQNLQAITVSRDVLETEIIQKQKLEKEKRKK